MENARIVIFEDNASIRNILTTVMDMSSHSIVAEAATAADALAVVDRMAAGELEADVVVLDGNLDKDSTKCENAKQIAAAMREAGLTAKIIGFSSYELKDFGIAVDVDLTKQHAMRLGKVIDSL